MNDISRPGEVLDECNDEVGDIIDRDMSLLIWKKWTSA